MTGKSIICKRSLCLVLFLLIMLSCSGGGGGGETLITNIAKSSVSPVGDVSFTGSNVFSGFRISAQGLSQVSGGVMEVTKSEPPDMIGDYVIVGPVYETTFYDRTGAKAASIEGNAVLTIPYNPEVISRESVDPSQLVVVAVNGTVVKKQSGTSSTDSSSITFATDISSNPVRYAAAYIRKFSIIQSLLPLIDIEYEGYGTALKNPIRPPFKDPQGNLQPDWAKGRNSIQVGGRILLTARKTDAIGYDYTSFVWELLSKPAGSNITIIPREPDFSKIEFVVDVIGDYQLRLSATSKFVTDTSIYTARARSLTYLNTANGLSNYCVVCHNGRYLDTYRDVKDAYGRPKLRDLVTPWKSTRHFRAFEDVKNETNSICMECHTTGFLFADRNRDGIDDFPESQGYDTFITDWKNPAKGVNNVHLRGVTCEACHGPGGAGIRAPQNSGMIHEYKANLSAGPCFGCHETPESVPAHFQEWGDLHYNSHIQGAGVVMKNEPCFQCHVGQAFLSRILTGKKIGPRDVSDPKGVTCATCHDPHNETGLPKMLRAYGTATLLISGQPKNVNAGLAAVCYNCHNANNSLPNISIDPRGNESEMVEGMGGYHYGDESPVVVTHGDRVKDKCVTCHMNAVQGVTHARQLINNGVYNLKGCITSGCHEPGSSLELPDTGDRFDFKGRREEIRQLLTQLRERINTLLGNPLDQPIKINYTNLIDPETLLAVNRAAYNHLFVYRDGSYGVHNYPYAKKLLTASLNDLKRF